MPAPKEWAPSVHRARMADLQHEATEHLARASDLRALLATYEDDITRTDARVATLEASKSSDGQLDAAKARKESLLEEITGLELTIEDHDDRGVGTAAAIADLRGAFRWAEATTDG